MKINMGAARFKAILRSMTVVALVFLEVTAIVEGVRWLFTK